MVVLCIAVLALMPVMVSQRDFWTVFASLGVSLAIYGPCYALSRTRHFKIAGCITVGAIFVATMVPATLTTEAIAAARALYFGSVAVFLAAFLFDARLTIITGAVVFTTQAAIAFGRFPASADFVAGLVLTFINTVLIGVVARTKESHLRQIRAQQEKIVTSSKMSSLGEMAGGIAHEINNPLTVIIMRARHIMRIIDKPGSADDIRKYSAVIESTSKRIAEIVTGLRDFSREETSIPVAASTVENIIKGTLAFCGQRLEHHGIDLVVAPIPPGLSVYCRTTQISQIVLNLLNNAHDAVADQREKWIRVNVTAEGSMVKIAVVDSGNGIASAIRSRIFEPFFTTKEIGKGTGIGLSISARLASANGGMLELDTNAANTTFILKVPLHLEPPALVNAA